MFDNTEALETTETEDESRTGSDSETSDASEVIGPSVDEELRGASSFRLADAFAPIAAFGILLGIWTIGTELASIPSYLLPSPVSVGHRLVGNPDLYTAHALATLERIVSGGAAGIISGFTLAVIIAVVPPLRYALVPYLVTVRVLPKIAIAPLLLISLGTGPETAVLFIALIAFFPMALSTIAGLNRIDQRYDDLLRSVDANPVRSFVTVRLRFALPDVVSGLKQSVTLAVVGAVVAEWVVVDNGLGALVLIASENLLTDVMLAALVVLCFEGLVLYGLVALLERRLCWYE